MSEVPLEHLAAPHFTELVRTKFQVSVEPGLVVNLELAAVTPLRAGAQEGVSPGSPTPESFSLLFEGPANQPLGQRTYRFAHERLGFFDLFIVPIGADRNARQYEAVFNRYFSSGNAG